MVKVANSLLITKDKDKYIISMSPELQDVLGKISYIDYTEEETVEVDDSILNLESSKAVMELATPLSGRIIERHDDAISNPDLLNQSDISKNWIIKLTDVDEDAYKKLKEYDSKEKYSKD